MMAPNLVPLKQGSHNARFSQVNVLLVQPPNPPPVARDVEPHPADSHAFSPPWNLICLQAYLPARTRHTGHLVDCRLFTDMEVELVEAIRQVPAPRLVAVNTQTLALGETAAVLEVAKRFFPEITTVLLGEHPSRFPGEALLPRADYALAGDPEPILRNLLDYLGMEKRLLRVPGLVYKDKPSTAPYWLPTLKSLSLPDWDAFFWHGYQQKDAHATCRANARLSRGHTQQEADRAFGGRDEPLRVWTMDKLAANLQRCSVPGISEVFLTDPPGFWTAERLLQWCGALDRVRNMQPWSLQLLPAMLPQDLVRMLFISKCRRVQFLIPSLDPEVLARFGCTINEEDLAETVALLRTYDIRSHLRFWMGGPEESAPAEARILKFLRKLDYCSYSLQAFPFDPGSQLEETLPPEQAPMNMGSWMKWAWDPWMVERPIPFWGEAEKVQEVEVAMNRIEHAVHRSPRRLGRMVWKRLASQNWIRLLEDRASSLMPHPKGHES